MKNSHIIVAAITGFLIFPIFKTAGFLLATVYVIITQLVALLTVIHFEKVIEETEAKEAEKKKKHESIIKPINEIIDK